MKSSKRVIAPNPGNITGEQPANKKNRDKTRDGPFVPYLSHITNGATTRDIDPSSCIPLCLARILSDNAIMRLASILNGDGVEKCSKVLLTGMTSGTPTSIVVPLVGDLRYLVEEYAQKVYSNPADAEEFLRSHKKWFGIIDGCQIHAAIMKLRVEYPSKWGKVMWKVFCVRPGLELDEYRKLAVVQNERNKDVYHYEQTLYELLSSLRIIHDNIYEEERKKSRVGTRGVSVPHRDVAHRYDGGDHERNTTIRQAVSVASRLSTRTIEAIGEVANMACTDIILNNTEFNVYKLTGRASAMQSYDCRLFKKFLCNSTLKGAKNFMNAVKDGEEDAQVNTIYRVRHWSELNDYRPVKPPVLNAQYKLARLALDEECKFLSTIEAAEWPKNMDTTCENLLRTTAYDDDLMTNAGNKTDVLPKIWSSFKRQYPGEAVGIEKRAKDKGNDNEEETSEITPPSAPSDNNDETQAQAEAKAAAEEARKKAEEEAKRKEEQRKAELRTKADTHLSQNSISIHEMTFDEFARDVWKPSSKRSDLVLSAIPGNMDLDSAKDLPGFCRTVLKSGCYVFLLVTESHFSAFHKLFQEQGFKVCDHGFSIQYNSNTLRRRRNSDFPQRNSELAFIAKTHGQHPCGFLPDFVSAQDSTDDNASLSAFACFHNVDGCVDKLKRPNFNTPVFRDERSVDLFKRILRLLTPIDGAVVDPIGGALTTAMACLQTGRTCVTMDKGSTDLRYAVGRLRIFATPNATMQMLDVYTDPINEPVQKAGTLNSDDFAPIPIDHTPKPSSATPKPSSSTPKPSSSTPKPSSSISKPSSSTNKPSSSMPKPSSSTPNSDDTPIPDDTLARPRNLVPYSDELMPDTDESASNDDEPIPNPKVSTHNTGKNHVDADIQTVKKQRLDDENEGEVVVGNPTRTVTADEQFDSQTLTEDGDFRATLLGADALLAIGRS